MKRLLSVVTVTFSIASMMMSPIAQAEVVNKNIDLLNNKKTAAYVHSRTMIDAMYRLGVEQDKKFGLQQDCKSEYKVKPYSVAVLSPIDFPDNKPHPLKGVWNFRYELERCGDLKFYNTIFIANNNGEPPTIRVYFPGSTNANPLLVKDAMLSAMLGAISRSGVKDCKEIDVFDMRVTEKPHDVVEGGKHLRGVWSEAWTFRACGQMVDVPMTFIPDEIRGGTTYSVGPTKSR